MIDTTPVLHQIGVALSATEAPAICVQGAEFDEEKYLPIGTMNTAERNLYVLKVELVAEYKRLKGQLRFTPENSFTARKILVRQNEIHSFMPMILNLMNISLTFRYGARADMYIMRDWSLCAKFFESYTPQPGALIDMVLVDGVYEMPAVG
jgi:hypothetical protein